MQNNFPYLDIIIFGVIAIFLIFRLKNLLGSKTGFEETNNNKKNHDKQFTNVVSIDTKKNNLENIEINKKFWKLTQNLMFRFFEWIKNFF